MLLDLLETTTYIGLPIKDFYEMSLGEVILYIEQYNKRKEDDMRDTAKWIYQLGNLMGYSYAVSNPFVDGVSYPPIYEVFPILFQDEHKAKEVEDWEKYKAQFETIAALHNRKYEKSGGEE